MVVVESKMWPYIVQEVGLEHPSVLERVKEEREIQGSQGDRRAHMARWLNASRRTAGHLIGNILCNLIDADRGNTSANPMQALQSLTSFLYPIKGLMRNFH